MKHFCLDDSPRFHMIELDGTDSTNSFLAGYCPPRPVEMTLVTAEHQTAGRGQIGNHWEAEAGRNLLFSLMLTPPALPATSVFTLSEAIALSVREAVNVAIREAISKDASPKADGEAAIMEAVTVKWPNDIYVGDRKIAGILIENELQGRYISRAIIGVGLNVNQANFISDAPNPISLCQVTGQTHERRFILEHIMATFTVLYERVRQGNTAHIHKAYQQYLYRSDGIHPYSDAQGPFQASIHSVEPDGHLLLRDTDGILRRYAFKEVCYLIQNS